MRRTSAFPPGSAYPARSDHSTRNIGDGSRWYHGLLGCIYERGIKPGLGNCPVMASGATRVLLFECLPLHRIDK